MDEKAQQIVKEYLKEKEQSEVKDMMVELQRISNDPDLTIISSFPYFVDNKGYEINSK